MNGNLLRPSVETTIEALLSLFAALIAQCALPLEARLIFFVAGGWCFWRVAHRAVVGGGLDSFSSRTACARIGGADVQTVGEVRVRSNRAAKIVIVSRTIFMSKPVIVHLRSKDSAEGEVWSGLGKIVPPAWRRGRGDFPYYCIAHVRPGLYEISLSLPDRAASIEVSLRWRETFSIRRPK